MKLWPGKSEQQKARLAQAIDLYTPFLQQAFSTVGLAAADWLQSIAVASSVSWLRDFNDAS